MKFKNKDITNLSLQEKIGIIQFAYLNTIKQLSGFLNTEGFIKVLTKAKQIELNLLNLAVASFAEDEKIFESLVDSIKNDVENFIIMHKEVMADFKELKAKSN